MLKKHFYAEKYNLEFRKARNLYFREVVYVLQIANYL